METLENLEKKCASCKKIISDQEAFDSKQKRFLPMCSEHLEHYYNIYLKCIPLRQKLNI